MALGAGFEGQAGLGAYTRGILAKSAVGLNRPRADKSQKRGDIGKFRRETSGNPTPIPSCFPVANGYQVEQTCIARSGILRSETDRVCVESAPVPRFARYPELINVRGSDNCTSVSFIFPWPLLVL